MATDKDTGRNIIKTVSAMSTAFKEAGASASGSTGGIAKFFSSLKAGASAGWQSLSLLGKIGVGIAAISLAFEAAKGIYNYIESKSATNQNAVLSERMGDYDSAVSDLKKVEDELSNINIRIDEIKSKGKLELTDDAELTKLQNQSQELEHQITLLKQKAVVESRQTLKAAESAYNSTVMSKYRRYDSITGAGSGLPMGVNPATELELSLREFETKSVEYESALIAFNAFTEEHKVNGEFSKDKLSFTDKLKYDSLDIDVKSSKGLMDDAQEEALKMLEYVENVHSALLDIQENDGILTESQQNLLSDTDDLIKKYDYIMSGKKDLAKPLEDLYKASKQFSEIPDTFDGEATKEAQLEWFRELVQDLSDSEINLLGAMLDGVDTSHWDQRDWEQAVKMVIDQADETAKETAENNPIEIPLTFKDASDKSISAMNNITNAQKLIASQEAGKSLSPDSLLADGMQDYVSALEYVNGVYQLNAERVNEIVKAKTAEQIAVNNATKANRQQKYLENAKQIEEYRKQLDEANFAEGESADSIREKISALRKENASLRDECSQYDLMTSALNEATSAYQNWLNAKSATQTGDMFDGALGAIKQITDTLNDSDSDLFGRVGRSDYKAAVKFIVPDSIDAEDAAAVDSYIKSISDMFTFDKDGNRTGLNIQNFIQKSLDQGLLAINEAGTAYEVAGGKTMEDFATGLGLSLPLVRAMFGELEEFGAKFNWADEATKTIGDLGVAAYEAADAIREIDQYKDMKIVMDVSDFEDASKACETLDSTIAEMQRLKVGLSVDDPSFQHANDVIAYCVAQKQLLTAPAIMSVDVSKVTSDIAPALTLLQQFQEAQNTLQMNAAVGADTSQAESDINGLVTQIQQLDPEILTKIGLDPTSTESIQTYIDGLDADAIVSFGVDSSLVDAFEKASHTARGTVNWYDNTSNLSKSFTRTGWVYWKNANNPSSGSGKVNGSANASGSANLRGDWRAKGGRSLVGELGREIVVDPNTGKWYTVGDNGAEFVDIPDGAIVFNHVQSDALLENGRIAGRGRAMANGTALVTGYIPVNIGKGSGGSGKTPYTGPSGGARSSVENNYDSELDTFDWIEIAIDRIERVIETLGKTAESVFKNLRTRMLASADEITKITQEIDLQRRAYDKYISAAESVNLSYDLKVLVRNGAIDISQYDKDTLKLINDYKDLYEKALDCAEKIDDLHKDIAEIYRDRFDNTQKDFENQVAEIERAAKVYDERIDMLEERGYLKNADYYKSLQDMKRETIPVLNEELTTLQRAFNEEMSSGEIQQGSEAWYEMRFAIDDVRQSIADAELEIVKYDNTIRKISWDYFDTAQERVSKINEEAEFLVNLMDGKGMFNDDGRLSDNGTATMGMNAEKYGVYMAQADKYAGEIKRINRELANDPNNTKLIERRDALIKSQQEAILSAKSAKEAMIDLAKEGITAELEALKKLVDAYTDSLDSAKDLYEYQKKIADKTKAISTYEKQLAAYQNDSSEETRAKLQKIQESLTKAQDDLKDTEYDRMVSETKKTLDTLYNDYSDMLNARFDDIEGIFQKLLDFVNDNFIDINEYITKESAAVGYAVTEANQAIWGNGGVNGIGSTVNGIFDVLSAIAQANGVSFPAKSYRFGGLVDYTGIANVHGSASNPEMVLNADDTKNFIMLRNALRNMADGSMAGSGVFRFGDGIHQDMARSAHLAGIAGANGGSTIGSININIPIDHVEDYEDFMNHMKNDPQAVQMLQDMTIGRLAGKSSLSKNKYRW